LGLLGGSGLKIIHTWLCLECKKIGAKDYFWKMIIDPDNFIDKNTFALMEKSVSCHVMAYNHEIQHRQDKQPVNFLGRPVA